MLKKRTLFICVLFFCIFQVVPVGDAWAVEDAIIAVVNDDIVTLNDLKDYFHTIFVQLRMEGRSNAEIQRMMNDFRAQGIEKLIEDKLILSEANKLGLEINETAIDNKLARIKLRYATEEDFLNSLISDGATVTDLRNNIRDQLKMNFVVEQNVKSKITINPLEVTDFYNKNLSEFVKPAGCDIESICILIKNNPDEAKQKAQEALNLLEEGKSFEEVASQYSETPSIGFIERGQLLGSIENIVFSLKEGEISPVIEVDEGFFIFKLKAKVQTQLKPLEESKDEITKRLFQMKFKARFENWIAALRRDAFIEMNQ